MFGRDAEFYARRGNEGIGQYLKNVRESNLINQIISTFAPGISGSDVLAQNITRSGLVDKDTEAKLNALSSLQQQDLEFSPGAQKYKAGDVSVAGTYAIQRTAAEDKIQQINAQINRLRQTDKGLSDAGMRDGVGSYRKKVAQQIAAYNNYLKQAEAELADIKNLQDQQLKNE
jgi:hypothetical protein